MISLKLGIEIPHKLGSIQTWYWKLWINSIIHSFLFFLFFYFKFYSHTFSEIDSLVNSLSSWFLPCLCGILSASTNLVSFEFYLPCSSFVKQNLLWVHVTSMPGCFLFFFQMDVLCRYHVCCHIEHPHQLADDVDFSHRWSGQLLAVRDVAIPAKFASIHDISGSVVVRIPPGWVDLLLCQDSSQIETERFDCSWEEWISSTNIEHPYIGRHNQPTSSKRHQDDDCYICDVCGDVILWNIRLRDMVVQRGNGDVQSRAGRRVCRSLFRQRLAGSFHLHNQQSWREAEVSALLTWRDCSRHAVEEWRSCRKHRVDNTSAAQRIPLFEIPDL